MKAPEKIYVEVCEDGIFAFEKPPFEESIEYVRKDTLMEWLEQNRNQSQMWFDRYNDREDLSAKQVWEEVIAKINEL